MTTSEKTDAIVQYFADRQKLECSKTANDKISLKLMQWGDKPVFIRIKPTNDMSRFLSFTKDDIVDVDFVLFMLEKLAWRESYAIEVDELKQHLDADGVGEVSVEDIPSSKYKFFDLVKAHKYFN